MSDPFWLSDERMELFFAEPHDKPRADEKQVLAGIIFANRNGLRWRNGR